MKKSIGANTIAYPNPVWCVGSYDADGKPNVMTIAWGGICCSKPPAVTISLRKATYTYGCIKERSAYTISIPSTKYVAETDYFGMASGKTTDKFRDTGLTPVPSDKVDAPYIGEFPLILECKVIHTHEIGLHTQFIGEIMDIKADEAVLNQKEIPLMEKVAPFVFGHGIREYWSLGEEIGRAFDIGRKYNRQK
jgi:flavin reductase (DIM6/NTAB) family NADH-FMN oxidoreductase RutF